MAPERAQPVQDALQAVVELLPKGYFARLAPAAAPELARASGALDEALDTHLGRHRKGVLREYAESILWAFGLALIIRAFFFEAFSIPSESMLPTLRVGDHLFVNKIAYGLYVPFSPSRMIHWNEPERGQIIVFEYRNDEDPKGDKHHGDDYIKRVIALPGDRVRLEDNRIILNGEPVPTTIVAETTCPDEPERFSCPCVLQREVLDGHTFISQHHLGSLGCPQPNQPNWPLIVPGMNAPDRNRMGFGRRSANPDFPDVVVPDGHVLVMGDNRDQSQDSRFWGTVPFDRIKGTAFFIWLASDFKNRGFTFL